ncbi:gliding motility lipoprotein GldB [Flavobacterium humi]|uniref:Gliding motility lipoprotein GldB n=1 Tax=Flavobacterium humi TaxID=2562683 RepID=A0A4Z0L697_9FLAO|nr:gliding motility lipoprotein GldB [Flavobacterium humi]TGD57766.1 gliding motility lipoprotein GldB [Flavobacterium humi]
MKKILLFAMVAFAVVSCSEKSKVQEKAEEIPVEITVDRYDKAFFETPPNQLSKLKMEYPYFFPEGISDTVLVNKMTNPLWRELYAEVEKKYGNFEKEEAGIEDVFRYIKYYYPKTKIPKVVTVIQEMDTEYKVIYTDKMLIISLELYLGKNHKFYEYPNYMKQTFEPSQILPDIVQSFSVTKVKPPTEKDLLSMMVYAGKQLYMKDLLLPEYSDEDKICYTPEQIKWCEEHDTDVWRFFVEEKLLYSTDPKLGQRFIAPAPFSKFGLVSDNETPGRIGAWVGWQIVRSFMENNDVPMQQMMVMDAKEIFQKSKYKPKK